MPDRTPSQRGRSARSKGKRGELQAVAILAEHGIEAKRGLSQTRGGGAEVPDLVLAKLPGYHVEVKVGGRPDILAAMRQAVADDPGKVPLVISHRDREGWLATVPLDHMAGLLRAAYYQDVIAMTYDPCADCTALDTRGDLLAAWAPVVEAAGRLRDDRSEESVEAVVEAFDRVAPTIKAREKRRQTAGLSLLQK